MADPLPPLLTYCEGGDLEAAKAELQAGDVKKLLKLRDPDRRTPLHRAWANVNVEDHLEDEESWTPLHSCASRGAGALVAKLLEASADAEAQTSSGGAALHFAASKGHEEVLKQLVAAGADINCKDRNKGQLGRGRGWRSPASQGHVSHAWSISAKRHQLADTPSGGTPLLRAAGAGKFAALKILLEAQADVLCRDRAGENVFHIAINGQHLEMCELLFERDEAERLMIQENEDGKTAAQMLLDLQPIELRDKIKPGLMKRSSLDLSPLYKAFLHLVAPPCIFLCVTALLSFHVHFQLGLGTWLLALVSLWPYQLARKSEARALEFRLDRTWPRLSLGLGVWIEGGHFRDREFWKVLGSSGSSRPTCGEVCEDGLTWGITAVPRLKHTHIEPLEGRAERPRSTGTMRKSYSSGTLQKTGQATITSPMAAETRSADYSQINWPLPKMFGKEKYGYSMIDIDDPRYIKESECAQMSQKLIRLHYDQQIIDYTWRNTYKGLLTAEHRLATLPHNKCPQKTEDMMKKEVDSCMKQLLELQQQKDMYEQQIKEIYERCDSIKATIKKENDLEDLRKTMEKQTKDNEEHQFLEKISIDSPFWKAKFNIRSVNAPPRSGSLSFD
eukprot:g17413.t1